MKPPIFIAFQAILILLLLPLSAGASFPEMEEIAEKVRDNYEDLSSWQVDLELENGSPSRIHCWRKDDLWRQEWTLDQDGSYQMLRAAVGSGQSMESVCPPAVLGLPLPPLHLDWIDDPLPRWQKMDLEAERMSYQFLGERPCVVVGAKHEELGKPQVWIDIEHHVPLKLVNQQGVRWQWKDYYNLGNYPLPSVMRIEFPEKEEFQFHLDWRRVGTQIDPSFFEPRALREVCPEEATLEWEETRLPFLINNLPRTW